MKIKTKLQSLKGLKKKAWQAISKFVRERDGHKCVTCKRAGNNCGHYQPNTERNQLLGGNELWYDLRNLNCQCSQCNNYKSGNLTAYALYLEKKYGKEILQELNKLYLKPKKWTREEILKLIDYWNKEIERL